MEVMPYTLIFQEKTIDVDNAEWHGDFRRTDGNSPLKKSSYKLLYTPGGVWVGIRCDISGQKMPSEAEAHARKAYQSECVDLMLSPSESAETYRHFVVNLYNIRHARICEPGGVIGKDGELLWESAVHRGDGFWSVEIRIPYSSLGIFGPESIWRLNIGRENHAAGEAS